MYDVIILDTKVQSVIYWNNIQWNLFKLNLLVFTIDSVGFNVGKIYKDFLHSDFI